MPSGLRGVETNLVAGHFDPDVGKSDGLEPRSECLGIDGYEDIVHVELADGFRVDRIDADESSPGTKDPLHLCEEPILDLRRRHVMKHRKASRRGKPV